jgi:hypothetical protein
MFVVIQNKIDFMQMLPKGGRWAEIGVFRGDLSEKILSDCQPESLHLIDPWHFELDFDWFAPPEFSVKYGEARKFVEQVTKWTGVPAGIHLNEHFEALYNGVKLRFANDTRVTIHRQTAHDAAKLFADAYFDFVYVDGAHDYENVLHDLTTYDRKLKPDGALIGDDYCDHGVYANAVYGVVGAVTHFRKISTLRELVLNVEMFTTFGLFRPGSRTWQVFLDNMINSGRPVIELPDALAANYWHRPVFTSDGKGRLVQSFA